MATLKFNEPKGKETYWNPQHPLRVIEAKFVGGGQIEAEDLEIVARFLDDPDIRVNNLAKALELIAAGNAHELALAASICKRRNEELLKRLMQGYQQKLERRLQREAQPQVR